MSQSEFFNSNAVVAAQLQVFRDADIDLSRLSQADMEALGLNLAVGAPDFTIAGLRFIDTDTISDLPIESVPVVLVAF